MKLLIFFESGLINYYHFTNLALTTDNKLSAIIDGLDCEIILKEVERIVYKGTADSVDWIMANRIKKRLREMKK